MRFDDLQTILDRYPAGARPLSAPEFLGNAGGNSGAMLWRFDSGQGPLLARAWPAGGIDEAQLGRIHHWLSLAAFLDFIPVPIPDRREKTVQDLLGRLWEVCPWMAGTADLNRPPDRSRLVAAFRALASFHQALANQTRIGPSPGLSLRLTEVRDLLVGGFDVLEASVFRAPSSATRTAAMRWLALARRVAPGYLERLKQAAASPCKLQPCLRDVRPDHFLFEGDHLTGLIDFGAMGLDVVSGDLARLLAEWVEEDRWARGEALNAYSEVRKLEDWEARLIAAFEGSAALLGAGHWLRWHYLESRVFDDPDAVASGVERGLERLVRDVARTLA